MPTGWASSPRTWGCFSLTHRHIGRVLVFPTHVGVCRSPRPDQCGSASSPRTWGCFHARRQHASAFFVFPTHVGVFLDERPYLELIDGLPHARGGVSWGGLQAGRVISSSPRTWGCFPCILPFPALYGVFPTHVGVFLVRKSTDRPDVSLPHARGGVSKGQKQAKRQSMSSPRTWGCFHIRVFFACESCVFPTHVGVFLELIDHMPVTRRLPHARGGVSNAGEFYSGICVSSPRTWGCF